jgi:putative alpha-1,2-mannosidase
MRYTRGKLTNFKNYFVIYLDKPFTLSQTWNDKHLVKDSLEIQDKHVGAVIGFKTRKGEIVNLKVASSFISFEQAELNLKREVGTNSFNTTVTKRQSHLE